MNNNRGLLLRGCGILFSLGLCLLSLGVVLFFLLSSDGSLGTLFSSIQTSAKLGNRQLHGAVIPLSTESAGQPADLLIENWQLDAPLTELSEQTGRQSIPIFLSATHEEEGLRRVRWETQVGTDEDSLAHAVAIDGSRVYVSAGTLLQALAQETGEVIWETQLSDLVDSLCIDCLEIVGNRLVILSKDQVLRGLDAATGGPVWQVALTDDTPRSSSSGVAGFSLAGDRIVVIDGIEGDQFSKELRLYSATDGTLSGRLRPTCSDPGQSLPDEEFDASALTLVDARNNRIIFIFESNIFEPCIQSWDLASGQLAWESRLPKGSEMARDAPPGLLNSLSGPFYVLGPGALYLSAEKLVDRNTTTFRVNLENGSVELLAAADDYAISPLAEQGGVLVVRAVRTRGTARVELWGLDSRSGGRIWQHELQAAILQDIDGGIGEEWVYRSTPGGFVVLQVLVEPDRLLFQKLDLTSGAIIVEQTSELDDRFWTGVAWTDSTAYLTVRRLVSVDLNTGEARPEWP